MHVCHLIDHLDSGGAQSLLLDVVRKSDESRVNYTICALSRADQREHFEKAGATVIDIDAQSARDFTAIARLYRTMNTKEYDVVHSHLRYARVAARIAKLPCGISCLVSTYHNTSSDQADFIGNIIRRTGFLEDVRVAVSADVKSSYGSDDSMTIIQNGLDVRRFRKRLMGAEDQQLKEKYSHYEPVFLSVGRYAEQKAHRDLIVAMDEASERLSDAHLLLVGHGDLERSLRNMVNERDLGDTVTVTGKVPMIHPYYSIADVFVLPSLYEGLPITVLEAMAAKLPVVGTNVPGIRELVVDSITGRLIPPNKPAKLAAALGDMDSPDCRSEMGEAGLRRVLTNYDVSETVESYLELYSEVCDC